MVRSHNLAWAVLLVSSALLAARPLVGAEAEPWAAPSAPREPVAVPVVSAELKPLWPRTWESSPGYTLRLRGRIDADAIWAEQSAENVATFGVLDDVVGLRRARVGIEGELGPERRYVAEIDLAPGFVVPRDVYFAHGERPESGEYQTGHFREPFSLEGGTSARYMPFLERSSINLLDPARNWGLAWFHENTERDRALALGVFHAGTGPADIEGGPGSTVDFTGRLTYCPVNEGHGRRLFHLGLALSERIAEQGTIVINQEPRSSLLEFEDSSNPTFVPRIELAAEFQQLLNCQLSAANGPLWAQAEWYGTWIDQTDGGTVFYQGCYVAGGYFLTGEHRRYDSSNGTLGAVRVKRPWLRGAATEDRPCGWGAWELAARFAYLDFMDADTPPSSNGQPQGLRLPQATYGVNWYLSDRVRLMLNYTYAWPDDINTGESTSSTIATRFAVFW